jgi:hypothetical protein
MKPTYRFLLKMISNEPLELDMWKCCMWINDEHTSKFTSNNFYMLAIINMEGDGAEI